VKKRGVGMEPLQSAAKDPTDRNWWSRLVV